MAVKVALAGATGNLGPKILEALLNAGYSITILTRKDSNSTDSLLSHANQRIVKVDYSSVRDLTTALEGVEVVVSTLASVALGTQKPLIDAAVAAGVKRFIPSEFGSDVDNPLNKPLPVYEGKVEVTEYLENIAKNNASFTYTLVYTNAFLDWGLAVGFIANVKEHKIVFYDGGKHSVSFTSLASIGQAVAGVINNQDATKNRAVYVHDTAMSSQQLIDLIKEIDGKDWTIDHADTKELVDRGYAELKKPEPNFGKAMFDFLPFAAFGKASNPDFTGRTENKLLGVPEDDMDYVKSVIKGVL